MSQNVKHIGLISLFVFLALYLLQPFGVGNLGHPFWLCLGFGAVTFIISLAYSTLFTEVFNVKKNEASWTLGRWILYTLGLLLAIATANFVYVLQTNSYIDVSFANFLQMTYSTLLIGSIPVVFSGFLIQIQADKKNKTTAAEISVLPKTNTTSSPNITIASSNLKQQITLQMDELIYLESQQNYVSVCILKGGKVEHTLLRNTLKNMMTQLPSPTFFRCHQSYIINLSAVKSISGNAQGLRLGLKKIQEIEVPVSRRYIADFREQMKKEA